MTSAEARELARTLIARARVGDMDAAHVLVDVLAQTRMPELGEQLSLALQHRHFWKRRSRYYGQPIESRGLGALVWEKDGFRLIAHERVVGEALDMVERRLLQQDPCLPLRRDVAELVRLSVGQGASPATLTRIVQTIWTALRQSCAAIAGDDGSWGSTVAWALVTASQELGSEAVARRHVYTRAPQAQGAGGHYILDYVDLGARSRFTGGRTIIYDQRRRRFMVADVEQVAAELTHRFGAGERPTRRGRT